MVTLANPFRKSPTDLIDRDALDGLLWKLKDRLRDKEALQLWELSRQVVRGGLPTLVPLLPVLLNLKGKPFSLSGHFPFEPFFNTFLPKRVVLKTGRQVSKSTNLAVQGVVSSNCIPFFNTLYVTPLFESVRRFSKNYVQPFIEDSPFRNLWTSSDTSSNVLQRSFRNRSTMHFSYAFLNADRTRGINADRVVFDEVQDMRYEFIQIILETLSGSQDWGLEQYAGTPKTMDNTLQKLWEVSSMGEWMIPCHLCRYENIPSIDEDLDNMVGDYTDVSMEKPGVVCARCQNPIFPHKGRWVHREPDRLAGFAGYHVPQMILPMHYAKRDKWSTLLAKRKGLFSTRTSTYYNECCGESYDSSVKLVTETDLKKAGCLHPNTIEDALKVRSLYDMVILAADWGGAGKKGLSWTTYAIMGWNSSEGKVDVLYGYRSDTPHNSEREAKIAIQLLNQFRCHFFVHDFNGAGRLRETAIIQAGYPYERVIPMCYVPVLAQDIMRFVPEDEQNARAVFRLDKPRSLALTCHQIRNGGVRFFQYDNKGLEDPGTMSDFLSLIENKTETRLGRDVYSIDRDPSRPDDFAQTVNMGCCAIWEYMNAWPDIGSTMKYELDEDLLNMLSPEKPDWNLATKPN